MIRILKGYFINNGCNPENYEFISKDMDSIKFKNKLTGKTGYIRY